MPDNLNVGITGALIALNILALPNGTRIVMFNPGMIHALVKGSFLLEL